VAALSSLSLTVHHEHRIPGGWLRDALHAQQVAVLGDHLMNLKGVPWIGIKGGWSGG
jgi:hypothetical protein